MTYEAVVMVVKFKRGLVNIVRECSLIFLTWSLNLSMPVPKCSQEAEEVKEIEW